MLKRFTWLLCLATIALADGTPPGVFRDSSFLRFVNKHYNSVHSPRTQWNYHPGGDIYRHASELSHAHKTYPIKTTESSFEHPNYAITSWEYWKPSFSNITYTGSNHYGYRTRPGAVPIESSYEDLLQGSHSAYQYPMRTATSNIKPSYYIKGNLQVQSYYASGKAKYKHKTPSEYKKTVYPSVQKPYVKHKYPARNTADLYKRYYQSHFQKYAIPPQYKLNGGYYKASTASPIVSDRYHTTERIDDAYPDGTSEDYSYNETHPYEAYEKVQKNTSEPEEISYDESTTRNYYGDRIYMSTQVPLVTSEKTGVKNKYFIIRRTADDDDIETIFE